LTSASSAQEQVPMRTGVVTRPILRSREAPLAAPLRGRAGSARASV
jgi:hypothetical protein